MADASATPNPNQARAATPEADADAASADDAATPAADSGPGEVVPPKSSSPDAATADAPTVAEAATSATFASAVADDAAGEVTADADISVDGVLATVTAERDEYLAALQRLKAEFANHKRRTTEQAEQQREQAAASLVEKLLPVLDSCDAAIAHDADAVKPISDSLLDALTRSGLERIDPDGEVFDPASHEAVMHEEGDGGDEPLVSEVLRAGYSWNGRVLRPAMVKVKG